MVSGKLGVNSSGNLLKKRFFRGFKLEVKRGRMVSQILSISLRECVLL
ncbi:hypothetical protein HPHPA17_0998 [Helicobacter pylori Hp A-17]|nr:hypothetical protein HPHPA17_0998 [Helicobacter pylori Hp A-17]